MDSFCLNVFAGCQNSLPELLFGCELPPTLIDLSFEDAPDILNRIDVRGGWGPHHEFFPFMPIAVNEAEVFLAA